jgi:DNA polymerase sigma
MIDISETAIEKVREILQKYIPNSEIRAFGSRISGMRRIIPI